MGSRVKVRTWVLYLKILGFVQLLLLEGVSVVGAHSDIEVYSTSRAFIVLQKSSGIATCWGPRSKRKAGGNCKGLNFTGISVVYSTHSAFMALNTATGEATCWGDKAQGGDCSQRSFKGFADVHSTGSAFLALNRETGEIQCWGNPAHGGRCPVIKRFLKDSAAFYSNEHAFVAVNRVKGGVRCWGHVGYGGNCLKLKKRLATKVFSTNYAFVALDDLTGTATCWGDKQFGGKCPRMNFSGVTTVYSTSSAFMALNPKTGSATCWGDEQKGGTCSGMDFAGITDVYSTSSAFMALDKRTGTAHCWGNRKCGGSCSGMNFAGVTDVYSTECAFMALNKATGAALCWGDKKKGGRCSGMNFTGVTDVYSTASTFLALNRVTGAMQCWGVMGSREECFGSDSVSPKGDPRGRWKKYALILTCVAIAAASMTLRKGSSPTPQRVSRSLSAIPSVDPSILAISFEQLLDLARDAEDKFGKHYKSVNMHEVNASLIRPLCEENGVSYAQLKNRDALLRADVFVSHCWSENFDEFVKSVTSAFSTWCVKPNLWICATALLQSTDPAVVALQVGTASDPNSAPFTKALTKASHLLVVRNTVVDLHTRIWCVWELYVASELGLLDRPGYLMVSGPNVFKASDQIDFMQATASNLVDKEQIVKRILARDGSMQRINDTIRLVKSF